MSPKEFLAGVHTHLKDCAPQFYGTHVKDVDFSACVPAPKELGMVERQEVIGQVTDRSLREVYLLGQLLIRHCELNPEDINEKVTAVALGTVGQLCGIMFWEFVLVLFPEHRVRYGFGIRPNWDIYTESLEQKDLAKRDLPNHILIGIYGVLIVNLLHKEAQEDM